MRYDPDAHSSDRNATHQRRRAQRAETQARRLRRELDDTRSAIAAERAALTAYLSDGRHEYDLLYRAETLIAQAVRQMTEHHRTCQKCGGFSREALDDLLAPRLARMRAELGLPDPEDTLEDRAGDWPVQKGRAYYSRRVLHPYERPKTPAKTTDPDRSWRPPHWNAAGGLSEW